jgi:hypothetical protein
MTEGPKRTPHTVLLRVLTLAELLIGRFFQLLSPPKLIDLNGDGLPDRVFDHNPEADDQPGFFVYLNTGDGFDLGKQWQSNLGGDKNWKNRWF